MFIWMQTQINKQVQAILHQLWLLEELERLYRDTKVAVVCVPEEGEIKQDAATHEGKLWQMWNTAWERFNTTSHCRLGREGMGGFRAVTVEKKDAVERGIRWSIKLK